MAMIPHSSRISSVAWAPQIGAATTITATRPPGEKARNPRSALARGFPSLGGPAIWPPHATADLRTATAVTTAAARSHRPLQWAPYPATAGADLTAQSEAFPGVSA